MAEGLPQLNVSAGLTVIISFASKSCRVLCQMLEKYQLAAQVTKVQEHPLVLKALEYRQAGYTFLGLALILHGTQFTNLLLCTQVITAFLLARVQGSVGEMWKDVCTAQEKLKADDPAAEETSTPKEVPEDKSKFAKKRDAKKSTEKTPPAIDAKEDVEKAKKALKLVDPNKLIAAGLEVLMAVLVCLLVIHGGIVQKAVVAYSLVGALTDKVESLLQFPGYEDLGEAWTGLFCRSVLWAVVLPMALLFTPVALALNASLCGAHLVGKHSFEFAKIVLDSKQGLISMLALAAFGTLWQLWSWVAGGSMAWYFTLVYLPAVTAEGVLGLL
jgi:hypothetical protein